MSSVEVKVNGTTVELVVDALTSTGLWTVSFQRNACNMFHARLEADAISAAIKKDRDDLVRGIFEDVWRQIEHGNKRHRNWLRRKLDQTKSCYL